MGRNQIATLKSAVGRHVHTEHKNHLSRIIFTIFFIGAGACDREPSADKSLKNLEYEQQRMVCGCDTEADRHSTKGCIEVCFEEKPLRSYN